MFIVPPHTNPLLYMVIMLLYDNYAFICQKHSITIITKIFYNNYRLLMHNLFCTNFKYFYYFYSVIYILLFKFYDLYSMIYILELFVTGQAGGK